MPADIYHARRRRCAMMPMSCLAHRHGVNVACIRIIIATMYNAARQPAVSTFGSRHQASAHASLRIGLIPLSGPDGAGGIRPALFHIHLFRATDVHMLYIPACPRAAYCLLRATSRHEILQFFTLRLLAEAEAGGISPDDSSAS